MLETRKVDNIKIGIRQRAFCKHTSNRYVADTRYLWRFDWHPTHWAHTRHVVQNRHNFQLVRQLKERPARCSSATTINNHYDVIR